MWIVQFNNAKSGKRSNIYGPFDTPDEANTYGHNNVEWDETFEEVYLCQPTLAYGTREQERTQ